MEIPNVVDLATRILSRHSTLEKALKYAEMRSYTAHTNWDKRVYDRVIQILKNK